LYFWVKKFTAKIKNQVLKIIQVINIITKKIVMKIFKKNSVNSKIPLISAILFIVLFSLPIFSEQTALARIRAVAHPGLPVTPIDGSGCIKITKEIYDTSGNPLSNVAQFTFTLDGTQVVENDVAGYASFEGITPGWHDVIETPQNGWAQTSVTPTNGHVNVLADNCVGVTFKNRQTTPTIPDTNTPPIGYLDGSSCSRIEGWALDMDSKNTGLTVQIYEGNTFIGSATANLPRSDVSAVYPYGDHAFNIPTPSDLKNTISHIVSMYALNVDASGRPTGTKTLLSNSNLNADTIPACQSSPLPTDGGWSDWSTKDNTCGISGVQTRTCTNPTPMNGGAQCVGSSTKTYTNAQCTPTPIDGGWSDWSIRNNTCGISGVQTRTCTNPTPMNGGAQCVGPSTQTYTNTQCSVTPINGGWSDWSERSTQCGVSGTQTRSCTNPSPAGGGATCSGTSTQTYTNTACTNDNPGNNTNTNTNTIYIYGGRETNWQNQNNICLDTNARNYGGLWPCLYSNYQQPVTVTISADQPSVNYNQSTIIRWSPINATSCYGTGGSSGWSNSRNTYSDTFNTGPLLTTTTYTISCSNNNGGGSDSKSVTVYVNATQPNPQPTVNLTADNTNLTYNGATTVRWSSSNATTCYATEGSTGWTGLKNIGPASFYTGSLTSGKTYTITCSNNYGQATDSVYVGVRGRVNTVTPTAYIIVNSSVDRNQPIVPTIDNTKPHPGDEINYTINYQNIGNASITNLNLRITLPGEVDYILSTPNSPTISGNTLVFNLGTLKANTEGAVTTRVRVRPDAPAGTLLNFPAFLSYNDPAGNPQTVDANVAAQVWSEPTKPTDTTDDTNSFLGANVLDFGSFFPTSLFGWLLFIILVLVLVLLGKNLYIQNQNSVPKKPNH